MVYSVQTRGKKIEILLDGYVKETLNRYVPKVIMNTIQEFVEYYLIYKAFNVIKTRNGLSYKNQKKCSWIIY